jgi:glycosyltransferase-like protein LARGE
LDEWLAFWNDNEDLIQQYVSFHILMEQPQLPLTTNRHPINRLRNLALRNAETDHVFINDVDFIPPAGAHDQIAPLLVGASGEMLLKPKMMWVLPAFERFGSSQKGKGQFVADVALIPPTKVQLLEAIEKKETAPFHDYFKAGHAPSNYIKWYSATERYPIQYDYLYEPYVICHKQGLPQFFPTFRGFAFNKMSFFMEAHYMGFQFEVLPDQYVVHMNHGGRKGRNDKGGDSKYIREDFRAYLQQVHGVTRSELLKWK